MAISFATRGEGLRRLTGSFLDPTGDFTTSFWCIYLDTVPDALRYRISWYLGTPDLDGDAGYSTPFLYAYSDYAANNIGWGADPVGDFTADVFSPVSQSVTQDVWFYVTVTYDSVANLMRTYLNGTLIDSLPLDLSAASPFSGEWLGYDVFDGDVWPDIGFAYYRSWSVVLTEEEITEEMLRATATRTDDLFCDTPLNSILDLLDTSGNDRNWSVVGTAFDLDSPITITPEDPEGTINITKSHDDPFIRGQNNATYEIIVTNNSEGSWTDLTTVTDTIPEGLTLVLMAGDGWICEGNVCTRSDTLISGNSFPIIIVTLSVNSDAPDTVTNIVSVSDVFYEDITLIIDEPVVPSRTRARWGLHRLDVKPRAEERG